jgi:alanine dehydrogenase
MKIGIIKEGKNPPDTRTPMTPDQCASAQNDFGFQVYVESSPTRCYTDEEFAAAGIRVTHDVSHCDVLLGIKEVPVNQLIPSKTYFFFSHTIKKQPHNRKLLQTVLEKCIKLIDYEVIKDDKGNRLIAFGTIAGMVGAHNALWTYARRTGKFHLKRLKEFQHYEDAVLYYKTVKLPPVKIVLTGTGRVSSGADLVLHDMGVEKVTPQDFLVKTYPHAVYCQLDSTHYVAKKDRSHFEKNEFYLHPTLFVSAFSPYYAVADIMINGIFWNNDAPPFFNQNDMQKPEFNIQVIADVTCDLAPNSSIPATLHASTIENPVYGYDPKTGKETEPFLPDSIDVMAIDNLPNELARDASLAFGSQFIKHILPELRLHESSMLDRATIAARGELKESFQYLEDYVGIVNHP